MSRTLFLTLLVACSPSLESANRHAAETNQRSIATLEQARAAAGTPFKPAIVSFDGATPVLAGARSHGLAEEERIYATPSGLVFIGGYCTAHAGCGSGCSHSASYHFAHAADGHVVILRERPILRSVNVEVAQCGDDCGGGTQPNLDRQDRPPAGAPSPPPPPLQGDALGVSAIEQVEVRDMSYAVERVATWCKHPIPRP